MRVWLTIALLATGTFALKAAGPMALAGRRLPPRAARFLALLPAALLAGLVLVQTVGDGRSIVVDARLAGLAAASVALWRKQGFLVVVLVAMAATAAARAVGSA